MTISPCPNCGTKSLFRSAKSVSGGGGYAPDYLKGLGGWAGGGKFDIVICPNCGLTRFFASPEARAKLASSKKWERI